VAPVKRLAVLWVALWLSNQALPHWYESTFLPPAEYRTLPDIMLDVLGEGRTMLARVLWFKMDLFHEVLDDQGVENSQQVQVMPLLRMATYLDPHLDDAYDVMAWDLYRGHGRTDDALALLDEGLRYNPTSYLLGYRRALILFRTGRYAQAAASADAVLAQTTDSFSRLQLLRLLYHCYDELKDDRKAERVLNEMLVLLPGDEAALNGLAKLRQRR